VPGGTGPAAPLWRVQRGLEDLYRVHTGVEIGDFVVGAELRDALVAARRPREQLLVCEDAGELALALFIDPRALANLVSHDPARRLGDHNLGDFLLVVEGVSHFIYAIRCARAERPVSQLELELQAEVDKFVLLAFDGTRLHAERARHASSALYANVRHLHPEGSERGHRYRLAASLAERVAGRLATRVPSNGARIFLQRFYRGGQADKIRLATAC
jgi:hypothetical protein